jgi:hypothetical protein
MVYIFGTANYYNYQFFNLNYEHLPLYFQSPWTFWRFRLNQYYKTVPQFTECESPITQQSFSEIHKSYVKVLKDAFNPNPVLQVWMWKRLKQRKLIYWY